MQLQQYSAFDIMAMKKAIALAWEGKYTTSPNPRVGCVIAINDKIVAEGYHQFKGGPHAEINALKQIAPGTNLSTATVYVTLEPCSHYGATPPCAQTLVENNIKKVVAAMQDPNPLVSGKGFEILKNHGVLVQVGLLEANARELNQGYLSKVERHRPFARLKMGMSLDGKIAIHNGESKWITSNAARLDVQELRAESCAILTGIGTVLQDNPQLNVRDIKTSRQPIRIVLDKTLKIPLDCSLIKDSQSPTWIVTSISSGEKFDLLTKLQHIKIIQATEKKKQIDLSVLFTKLAELGIGDLLIECGPTLAGSLLDEDLIDELHCYQAPIILGNDAKDAFNIAKISNLASVQSWQYAKIKKIKDNIKLVLKPK